MAYENLKEKYCLTEDQIKKGIDIVSKNLSKICDTSIMLAIVDLLATGDIKIK